LKKLESMKKGQPISPAEIPAAKQAIIPGFVFDAFNECIAANWSGGSAMVLQKDVVAKIKASPDYTDPFKYEWLDVKKPIVQVGSRSCTTSLRTVRRMMRFLSLVKSSFLQQVNTCVQWARVVVYLSFLGIFLTMKNSPSVLVMASSKCVKNNSNVRSIALTGASANMVNSPRFRISNVAPPFARI
jgi:hypothetical protein